MTGDLSALYFTTKHSSFGSVTFFSFFLLFLVSELICRKFQEELLEKFYDVIIVIITITIITIELIARWN